jgi:hypothetical protein
LFAIIIVGGMVAVAVVLFFCFLQHCNNKLLWKDGASDE